MTARAFDRELDDDLSSIVQAIQALPDPLREVLVLREIEGLSYQELADATGVPIDTVLSRLSRARQALSGALSRQSVAV